MKRQKMSDVKGTLAGIVAVIIAALVIAACPPKTSHVDPNQSVIKLYNTVGQGTGFEIQAPSGRTLTVTNAHVCENSYPGDRLMAEVGDRTIPLKIMEVASFTDLCVLEGIQAKAYRVAAHDLIVGDHVDIWGFGMGMPLTHTDGIYICEIPRPILAVQRPKYATATILPGNSGSPVLNVDGEVVGVAYASSPFIGYRSVIVPLDDINKFLRPY